MIQQLEGGRKSITRDDDRVYRPAHEWSYDVHQFLKYLHEKGFNRVPFPYAIHGTGQEEVSFIAGEIHNGLLPDNVKSDETLIEFAKFIRTFHDLGAEYIQSLTGDEKWMLPIQTNVETMCHGDLAPYNTVVDGKHIVGLIDFDTLHPGSRLWDIAYALYRWIPLMSDSNPEDFGDKSDKLRRLKIFFKAYGTDLVNMDNVMSSVIKRLEFLVTFMEKEAHDGDQNFENHIAEGHIERYLEDIEYIKSAL